MVYSYIEWANSLATTVGQRDGEAGGSAQVFEVAKN
jgi:hypothetical protein